MSQISQETETSVVVRLARKDSPKLIAQEEGIAEQSVYDIKKRNLPALQAIQQNLLQKKESVALRLVEKANQAIEQRLDETLSYDDKVREIQREYEESEQTDEDKMVYRHRLEALRRMTVNELVAVSREGHSQSQNAPESPTDDASRGSRAELDLLLEAIKSGDEVKLQQIVLNPKDD